MVGKKEGWGISTSPFQKPKTKQKRSFFFTKPWLISQKTDMIPEQPCILQFFFSSLCQYFTLHLFLGCVKCKEQGDQRGKKRENIYSHPHCFAWKESTYHHFIVPWEAVSASLWQVDVTWNLSLLFWAFHEKYSSRKDKEDREKRSIHYVWYIKQQYHELQELLY